MKKIILSIAAIGAVSLSTNAAAYNGATLQCREYTRTIYVGCQPQECVGTACLQPDGSWQIVSQPTVPATLPATTTVPVREVVVHQDHYYPSPRPYYYSSYYPARSGISISLGNSWGPRHYGHRSHYRGRGYGHHHKHRGRGHGHH